MSAGVNDKPDALPSSQVRIGTVVDDEGLGIFYVQSPKSRIVFDHGLWTCDFGRTRYPSPRLPPGVSLVLGLVNPKFEIRNMSSLAGLFILRYIADEFPEPCRHRGRWRVVNQPPPPFQRGVLPHADDIQADGCASGQCDYVGL